MPTGAHGTLLPIHSTKTGAGDKERAYVMRQNVFLKGVLITLVLLATLLGTLTYTTYEVHVAKRGAIETATAHRAEEHGSHLRALHLSTLLQTRLKDEVHDMKVLTQYRAWLLRAVGDYQNQVAGTLEANCTASAALKQNLQELGLQFDNHIDSLLKRLWDDLVQEGKAAQTHLHNITAAIMSELKQEASQANEFEQLMHENGEHVAEPEEGEGDEHSSLGVALEAFHEHLKANDSVVHVSNATIAEWQQKYDMTMRALSDDEEEADMERINKNIREMLSREAEAPPYDAQQHASELDFLTDLLFKAKLAAYRNELLVLLDKWSEGDFPLSVPLRRVEQLIDDGVLQPDVLQVEDDDYRYDYHYDHDD